MVCLPSPRSNYRPGCSFQPRDVNRSEQYKHASLQAPVSGHGPAGPGLWPEAWQPAALLSTPTSSPSCPGLLSLHTTPNVPKMSYTQAILFCTSQAAPFPEAQTKAQKG